MAWMRSRCVVPVTGVGGVGMLGGVPAAGAYPVLFFFIFFYIFYPRGTLRGTKNPVTGYSTIFEFTRIYMNLHEFT